MTDKSKPTYFNQPLVIKREEIVRSYDSKNITWEKRFMPELVENYKRIRRRKILIKDLSGLTRPLVQSFMETT